MDWCPIEPEFSTLIGINEQTQNLERAVLRENEINKNLQNVLQKMVTEIKVIEEQTKSHRETIKVTLHRQKIVEDSIESTNQSCHLVEKLRCDLKKQVTLEQMRTEEQMQRLQKIVNKYKTMWKAYEAVYNMFPMVPQRNNLKSSIRKLEIVILQKKKLQEEEEIKLCQIRSIREKIMKLKIVQFAKLTLEQNELREKCLVMRDKLKQIIAEIQEKEKEKSDIEHKLLQGKENLAPTGLVASTPCITPTVVTPVSTTESQSTDVITNEKVIRKVPERLKTREMTKNILFSPLEMTHIELPLLKLPIFDSPPQKIQRVSRPIVRPVRLFPEYSFQDKEFAGEDEHMHPEKEKTTEETTTDKIVINLGVTTTLEDHMEVDITHEREELSQLPSVNEEEAQKQQEHQYDDKEQQEDNYIGQREAQGHQQQKDVHIMEQDLQTSQQLEKPQQEQQLHQQEQQQMQQQQNEVQEENFMGMQIDEDPAVEMQTSSQPTSDLSDTIDSRPLNNDESFDSTSERARREYLSRVIKSPEFTFIPRKYATIDEMGRNEDIQEEPMDTRSEYFLNPVTSSREPINGIKQTESEVLTQQDVPSHVGEPEFSALTSDLQESQENCLQQGSPKGTDVDESMMGSDDLLALSFHSLSPPDPSIRIPGSPPATPAAAPPVNQGFSFNFAPQPTSNIMSLFGEGEQDQGQEDNTNQQKKSEAFSFTFDKKTKSSSFFKLF